MPELAGLNPVSAADSAPPTLPSTTASVGQNSTVVTGLHGLRQPLLAPQAVAGPITPKNPLLPAWSAVRSLVLRCHAGLRLPRWVELGILTTVGAFVVLVVFLQAVRLKNSFALKRARETTEANARVASIAKARADAEKIAREQAEQQERRAKIRADAEAKAEAERSAIAEVRAKANEGDRKAQLQLAKLLDGQASAAAWLACSSDCGCNTLWRRWGRTSDEHSRYAAQLAALNERATNVSANSANSFFRGKHWHDHPLPAEALDMYRRAAEQGSAEAQVALGDAFGPFTDLNHAVHPIDVLRPAYEDDGPGYGFSFAEQQKESARLAGVPRNESEAFKWYYRAAQQGDVYAQGQIANALAFGKHVMKNPVESCKWALLSGESESFPWLTEAQFASAISMVRSFKPTGPDVELVAANRVKVFAERRARKQAEEKERLASMARMDREFADREREKLYALNKFTSSISAAAQNGSLTEMAKNPSWRRFRADEIRTFDPSVANDPAKVEQRLEKLIREASQ